MGPGVGPTWEEWQRKLGEERRKEEGMYDEPRDDPNRNSGPAKMAQ